MVFAISCGIYTPPQPGSTNKLTSQQECDNRDMHVYIPVRNLVLVLVHIACWYVPSSVYMYVDETVCKIS